MKRLIYLLYLSLLALILVSCEKESIVPATTLVAADLARNGAGNCHSHQYLQKAGVFNLGIARSDYVLVGFANNVMPAQQQAILAQFPVVDQISSDVFMDSGIITVVKLTSNANCNAVENLVASLERKPQVKFAAPVFDDPFGVFTWMGPSNEIIVTLRNAADYQQFLHLNRKSRTTIVTNLFDDTYLVSTDKHAAGNALEMTSLFNASSFVKYADPNFITESPAIRGSKPELQQRKALLNAEAAL